MCALKISTVCPTRSLPSNHEHLDPQRPHRPRRAHRRRDRLPSRYRPRVQRRWRTQSEKSARLARQDTREFLCRAKHTHTHLVRGGGHAPERGCREHLGHSIQPSKRRNTQGHRLESPSPSSGHHRPPPQLARIIPVSRRAPWLEHHKCRRRRPRTPHAGPSRHIHHPRKIRPHRGTPCRHSRRHPVQPRRPLEYFRTSQARRQSDTRRPINPRS